MKLDKNKVTLAMARACIGRAELVRKSEVPLQEKALDRKLPEELQRLWALT